MLTNLNWLEPGATYPPSSEKKRIERYKLHEQLFLSQHPKALEEAFQELARRHKKSDYQVETVINYQQLLSKKTADFICGEPPTLETEGDTDKLDRLLEQQRWHTRLYEGFIDVSRYGNGVFKLVGKRLTQVSPLYWFPIVDPSDLKSVIQHVIAYPITPNKEGEMTELYVEIHGIGNVEQRVYSYRADNGEIGKIRSQKVEKTNLEDFAVQVLTNLTHSGDIFGLDDYAIINSIVAKIMWRLHCADTILDKHSEPSLSGPSSALTWDERFKTYYLDLANYFRRDKTDDPDVSYITWDGNLEANWKELELLFQQLYTLTEMGQAFAEGGGGGEASSGTALKLRMVSPRIKAARLTAINAAAVKQIIYLLAHVNGISLDYDTLSITWQDGLPDDEVEEVNTLVTATGGKAIMSQYSALKRRGLTDEEVEAELEQIREEQAASSPFPLGVVDQNPGDSDDPDLDDE